MELFTLFYLIICGSILSFAGIQVIQKYYRWTTLRAKHRVLPLTCSGSEALFVLMLIFFSLSLSGLFCYGLGHGLKIPLSPVLVNCIEQLHFLLGITGIFFSVRTNRQIISFSLEKLSLKKAFSLGFRFFLLTSPLVFIVSLIWQWSLSAFTYLIQVKLSFQEQEAIKWLLSDMPLRTKGLLCFSAVFLAPILEEILFRGFCYRYLKGKWGFKWAMYFSAFLFALLHYNLVSFLPLFTMGVCFVYSYEDSGNILVPIIFHAFFNASSIALLWMSHFF